MSTFTAASDQPLGRAYAAPSKIDAITRLLADAHDAIGRDQYTAKDCLARASALLQGTTGRQEENAPSARHGGLAAWQAKRVCAYIEANLSGRILAGDLAMTVSLSTSHFFRVFRKTFGVAPLAFVARRRIQRAQEIMRAGREPLAQVALTCGLCDQAHFTRMFRRIVGATPRDWRREFCVSQSEKRGGRTWLANKAAA